MAWRGVAGLTSVIVPSVFNDFAVRRCVDLIKAHTTGDYELIVIDSACSRPACTR